MRKERVSEANGKSERPGAFVLYWMQASVRAEENLALDWAVAQANEKGLPLIALFCLVRDFPYASPEHYRYLIGGLREVSCSLTKKGVLLVVSRESPGKAVGEFAANAALVVTDCGYMRIQQKWLKDVADAVPCRLVRVEGDVVVPTAIASNKEEWSAFTLRRRIMPLVDSFLDAAEERTPRISSLGFAIAPSYAADLEGLAIAPPGTPAARAADTRIAETPGYKPALRAFTDFLNTHLSEYDECRSDPNRGYATSRMSAALHFGHISPISLVRRAMTAAGEKSAMTCANKSLAAYIEQLIVRRELAVNFVAHRDDYDAYSSLPDWSRKTLAEGALHKRDALYSFAEFEAAATHDPYWNAAQDQMVITGRMHGYMRMYWGKQILAWSPTPELAYSTAVTLNDRYSLDGRDPNGYAGIAWCFGKHDRPWTGRPVFGTVRYMNANGLRRKFDAEAYVRSIAALKEVPCSTTLNTPKLRVKKRATTLKSTRSLPVDSAKERSLF
ncbi:MAG: deoxyribodipyrimidine photo-lyase [Treponemataceae bacterium]